MLTDSAFDLSSLIIKFLKDSVQATPALLTVMNPEVERIPTLGVLESQPRSLGKNSFTLEL
jgi:hypothetical protein